MSQSHHVTILFGQDIEEGDKPKTFTFATKAELDAFMNGVEETSGWLDHQVIHDSREDPAPAPTRYRVRFYKDFTTRDRCTIIVEADSLEVARSKVATWGIHGYGLTDEEEATETIDKEGEVQDSEFYALAEEDDPYAVEAV